MADIEFVASRSVQVELDESGQRYVKLCIPSDYAVPVILCSLTPQDVGVLLDLAAKAYIVLCQTSSEHQSNEIIQNAIRKVREEAGHKVGALKAEHEQKETEMNASILQLKGELEAANAFKVTLKSEMNELVQTEVERAKELLGKEKSELVSKIERAYEKVVDSQKEFFDKELDRLRNAVEEVSNLKQKTTKSSAAIGIQGEAEFAALIASCTDWECTSTSKKPRSGDLNVKIRECEARFEIKNHSSNVPKIDVEKFYRDMMEHLETPFGVFVSLNTGIARLDVENRAINIQWTKHHQMVVFIQRFKEYDTKFLLQVLDSLSGVALRHSKERANSTESSALGEYERKMTSLSANIGEQLKDMKVFQTALKANKKSLQATIEQQFNQYNSYATKCLSGLQELISIISDKESNNQVVTTGSRGQSAEELHVLKRPRTEVVN